MSGSLAFRWMMAVGGLAIGLRATELPPEQLEFFESKIRPILVDSCYKCHSLESGKSKADLLLDSRDALRKGGATGPAITPGEPDKSLLIQAVRYQDEDRQMPPPDEGGKLSGEKIALLEAWVKMGAPDPRAGGKPHPMDIAAARQHWAFQPVVKPTVPVVKTVKGNTANPVDAFVLAKLREKNLSVAPAADKRTLLRRVTYGLTGLPPTPEDMDAFLADKSADAYPRVVEQLLASPRYGERWGRFWLDVARFADTKGYLAGNVERRYPFAHTYRDYVIRAFNEDKPFDRFIVEQIAADHLPLGEDKSSLAALGFLTLGRRFLNNQNDIIDDRIDVVTRGFMGLTVTCARCHDHKFDPVPTKDYYALHGVFASSEEPAERPLLVPLAESPEYRRFLEKTAELEAKIKERAAEETKKFLSGIRAKTGDYLLAAHDLARQPPVERFELFAGTRKLNADVLKRWQAFLAEPAARENSVLAPWLALAAAAESDFPEKASALLAAWQEAAPSSENASTANQLSVVVVEALAKSEKPMQSLKDAAAIYNTLAAKVTDADSEDDTFRALLFAPNAPPNLGPEETATMLKRQIDTKTASVKREIEALNWTQPGAPLRAMALVDKAAPADSKIFLRGNPANRGPEAPRQFLEILSDGQPVSLNRGSGRLDLAGQIAHAKNPLTARVFVNRVWGWHFGTALVRTPSDFGVRTEPPVHRALLDWLAASFVERGWSVKQLHRWIVLSQAYRQSSDENAAAATVDPDNTLVHRFPRRRLEFEALRDTVLAVSGALDLRAGGIPDDLTVEPFATRRTVYGFIDRQNLPGMFRTFDYPNPDTSASERFATTVPQQALYMMNSRFVQEQARRFVKRMETAKNQNDATGVRVAIGDESEAIRALYRIVYQREPHVSELDLARSFVRQPINALEMRPPITPGWQYGYGRFDDAEGRVRDFQTMNVRADGRVTPSTRFPDKKFGSLKISGTGGHPGNRTEFASVRRWISPGKGKVKIEGALAHANAEGDGVRGRIVSSEAGCVVEWIVHNRKAAATVGLTVQAGEAVDFLVESMADPSFDSYTWAPTIAFTPDSPEAYQSEGRWSATADFGKETKPVVPLTRWEELAQVLLLSNEVAFLD